MPTVVAINADTAARHRLRHRSLGSI